jgi:hypothetical protein
MPTVEPRITIPLRSRAEKRQAERFEVAMPVRVEGAGGNTLDLSASGLAFESERPYAVGEQLEVTIEYVMDGHDYPLRVQAEVVRCDAEGERWRVGARLLSPIAESPYDTAP